MHSFSQRIRPYVERELGRAIAAERQGDVQLAFRHLERAHVLGQASTRLHLRAHWLMLRWGLRNGDLREVLGQLVRLIGAASKTAIGLVPPGNTGGTNVSPFKTLPVPADLAAIIAAAREGR